MAKEAECKVSNRSRSGKEEKSRGSKEVCFEAGVFSLYGRQRGLAVLAGSQGGLGVFLDSCYTGEGLVGSARWEAFRALPEFRGEQLQEPADICIRFGGGAAAPIAQWRLIVGVGAICTEIRVLVVRGHLPFLLGEGGLAKLELDLCGRERAVHQRGQHLSRWDPGEMPQVQIYVAALESKALVSAVEESRSRSGKQACAEPQGSSVCGREVAELESGSQRESREMEESLETSGVFTIGASSEHASEPECFAKELGGRKKKKRKKAPLARRVKSAGGRRSVLTLSESELRRLHLTNHASPSRMINFLSCCAGKWRRKEPELWRKLVQRVKGVVSKCKPCTAVTPRVKRGSVVPLLRRWLERGVVDFFKVNAYQKKGEKSQWAMIVVDAATKRCALIWLSGTSASGTSAKDAWRAYVVRWAAVWGHFRNLVSDPDSSFKAKQFLQEAELAGVFKTVTPGRSSESHGDVERPIRTARWSLDRLTEELRERRQEFSPEEWEIALAQIENSMNNEVVHGGGSASERSAGRQSHMAMSLLGDSLATGREPDVGTLQAIQRRAQEAYISVAWDRRLRVILSQRAAPPSVPVELGDAVLYCREEQRAPGGGVRGRVWHGPGVVVGVPAGAVEYVRVDHGGVDYLCHRRDVRRSDDDRLALADGERATRQESDGKRAVEAEESRDAEAERRAAELALRRPGAHGPRARAPPGRPPAGHRWDPDVGKYISCASLPEPAARASSTLASSEPPAASSKGGSEADTARTSPEASSNLELSEKSSPSGADAAPASEADASTATALLGAQDTGFQADMGFQADIGLQADEHGKDGPVSGPTSSAGIFACKPVEPVAVFASSPERFGLASPNPLDHCSLGSESEDDELEAAFEQIMLAAQAESFSQRRCYFAEVEKRGRVHEEVLEIAELCEEKPCSVSFRSRGVVCMFSEGGMDAYSFTWDDLDEATKQEAYSRALRDYDGTGSWERGTEKTGGELKMMRVRGLEGREVVKAKFVGGELTGRVRWTPKGFQESDPAAWDVRNTTSPTVHRITVRCCDALVSSMPEGPEDDAFVAFVLDFSEAFFHSRLFEDLPKLTRKDMLYVRVPEWDSGEMSEEARAAMERGEKVYRRLLREVPGTKGAPQAWYKTIAGDFGQVLRCVPE